ncbi:MBL fold metallo-hydrolase [uncultured Ilyobacter sp.]|uniref:MBL fold metallo-hydrolase n=1 Tax=uncultured Ilyobacter sp. TaxID=544433 RepID=UPI0029C7A5CF|nr:MBL fold metallo-hydrolase [uncultured Ilyobacter sp.]
MKISILGSGSSGNATFLEVDGFKILVDAGFSGKKLKEKLELIGEKIEEIGAMLITHEHLDHILGAGIISRKYNIPIYITRESYGVCAEKLGKISGDNLRFIEGDFTLIDSVKVTPFDVMHDAERTIGFKIENSRGKKLAISTDIGYINNIVREHFKDVNIVVIECNYDYQMLMSCSYPWDLKARVKGRNGHLSNIDAAKFIGDINHPGLEKVYLAHVSRDSNTYEMAMTTVREELKRQCIEVEIEIAYQEKNTNIFRV